MTSNPSIRVLHPLAANASANPLDVLKIKSALGVLGYYEAPEWGLSEFPDPALFKSIQNFQRQHSLQVDGTMKPGGPTEDALRATMSPNQTNTALYATARTLQSMGRNGDTLLAHLTPVEAQLLDRITDGASINPSTGLLEFWHDYESESYGVGDREQNSGPDRGDKGGSDNDNQNGTRANPGGQDTLGSGTSLTAPATASTTAPDFARDETIDKPRTRTVLTPDNDPSFTAGFFDKKNAEEDAKEKDRQIWGSQKYWSPGDNPLPVQKNNEPAPGAPGTAENPTRREDSRNLVGDVVKYSEEKAAKLAVKAILGSLLRNGFPALMMTKKQADMFRVNDDPA